jgi:hypothetical protein
MIKSNRVIQTTIFVVFLFVVLSLPIFNKPGVIFVQAAPYIQCTVDNLNGKFQNDWEQMCNILMGVHATTDFYRTGGSQLVGLEYYADCSNLKDTHGKSITAVMLSDAISKVCPIKEGANYNGNQKTALTNLCNYCSDPVKYADVFHNTKSLAAPTEQEYKQQQAEVPSSGGIPGENIPSWEPKSTEEGYCLLTDKNGVLLNKDPSPCALPFDIGWLNPLNSATGGLLYIIYLILRGVLVVILKVFQWLLNPLNFGGYINFLNFNPSSSNPSLVPQLWSFIKNFANLGIILGMIFTAIATILRIEKYSWKKMLPKLLLVALLVNFSLVIAGIFVDISSYIVNVTATSFNNISLSNLVVNCSLCPTVKAFYNLEGSWNLVRATGLGLILSALFFYQFIGLVFYVFIRILTIVICLITSPLAFLSFAFPGGEKVWDFWRKQFQQAIVILPVLCIVFVLSLQFINIIVSNLNNNIKSGDEGAFVIVLAYAGFVIVFAQLVRYVANFLGVEQVEKGFQMAKKAATTLAMAGVAAVGGFALGKALTSGAWKKAQEKLQKSNIQPLYGIGNWMDRQSDKFTRAKAKPTEEFLKNQTTESVRHYKEMARARGDKIGVALALNELIARDQKLEEKDSEDVHFAKSVPFLNIKDMKKANPMVFAENFTEPERLSKLRAVIQSRHPGLSFQDADRLAIERLTLELAQKSSPEKLKTGNWADILHHIEASGQNNLYNFLNNLVDSLRPEGLANVFQSMDEAQKRRYGNDLIAATQQRLRTPQNPQPTRIEARQELFRTHRTLYWSNFLHNLVP